MRPHPGSALAAHVPRIASLVWLFAHPAGAEEIDDSSRLANHDFAGELDELVVTVGSRNERSWIDSPGSVLSATAEDLVRAGTFDLAGFAKYDPSISLPFDFTSGDGAFAYGQSGYGSINIRGIEGNRIAIELDGIRQPPQYVSTSFDMGDSGGAGGVGRDYFDPSMFEMVEVLKGGASALYGSDALGGVVSFRTPDPDSFLHGGNAGGLLRTQYFSANQSFAAQAGGALRQGDTAVMLLYAGRWGEETENNGNLPPNPSDFRSLAALFKAEHRLNDHLFRLAVELFERETFIDARSAVTSAFPVFTDYVLNKQSLDRQRVSLRWNFEPGMARLDSLDTHLYWQHAGSRSDNDAASLPLLAQGVPVPGTERTRRQRITFDTDILGLSSIARHRFTGPWESRHFLTSGLELSRETSENTFVRFDNGVSRNRTAFAPTETLRAGVFVQDEIELNDRWTLSPGLRFDYQSIAPDPNAAYLERLAELGGGRFSQQRPTDFENLAISPRLTVSWKPSDPLLAYFAYAHGVRNPSAEELSMVFDHPPSGGSPTGSITIPNPDLEEETSDAFELGLKSEGPAGRAQATAHYTHYRDFIENGVITGTAADGRSLVTTENRGEAEIYGVELSGILEAGHFHPAAEGWQLGLSAAWTRGTNLTDDQPLNSIEPMQAIGFLSYENSSSTFGARLTGTWTASVDRIDPTTNQGNYFRPPSWFTLDLAAWWQPTENLQVHLGLNNLLDEKYWAWSSVRRGNGHLGGTATDDRSTAPGRNFSLTVTKTF
ncbi:TonB-dependent hemoglobin/transferrin/lactoferrin family receptor [Haloferula sargassicola]|uniref:Vitamin B12 transporter BtuB n=1 Tax=Haloferula sargassicola TaxID=490096 RepID=A0ABP9UNC6_9BACT